MTKEEFEQVFTALGLFWPRETVSDSRKAAWWLALKPYPYQGGVLIPPVQNLSSAVGSDSVSEVEGDLYAGSSEHFSPCRNPDDGDLFRTRHGEQAGCTGGHQ